MSQYPTLTATDRDPRVRDGQLREGAGARLRRRARPPRAGLPHRQGRHVRARVQQPGTIFSAVLRFKLNMLSVTIKNGHQLKLVDGVTSQSILPKQNVGQFGLFRAAG